MSELKKSELTTVSILEDYEVVRERKRFFIISWLVEISRKSIGKSLHIDTKEKYEKIYVNGKELTFTNSLKQ